jgi:NADPH2:quinone reductase
MIEHKGAVAIASTSTDEKVNYLKSLGIKHVVNYKKENLLERVLEITGGIGVHAALDSVGQATFETSLASLRPFGVAVIYGFASGPLPPVSSD